MEMETIWKSLLREIIIEGHKHTKDDSVIHELIGIHEYIPAPEFQGLNTNITPKLYLDLINKGAYNIPGAVMHSEALHDYVSSLDDLNYIDGAGFVYTYPERLQNYNTIDKFGETITVDQLEIIKYRLIENKGSNRAVATLYNCGFDGVEEDIPCLNWLQALIRDDKLTLIVMFRSNDCYGAWTSNMMFIHYIGIRLVEDLKEKYPLLTYEGIDYHCSSLHIYDTDIDAVKRVLNDG